MRIDDRTRLKYIARNRSAYVGPDKGIVDHVDPQAFGNIQTTVLDLKLSGLEELLQSGFSYFVATFKDTAHRDRGLKKLLKVKFLHGESEYPVKVEAFGAHQHAPNPGWTVTIPSVIETNCWLPFFIGEFTKLGIEFPGCRVAHITFKGTRTGKLYIRFHKRPDKFFKSFRGCDGTKFLLDEEGKICRGCRLKAGHPFWDCEEADETRLEKTGPSIDPAKLPTHPDNCGAVQEEDILEEELGDEMDGIEGVDSDNQHSSDHGESDAQEDYDLNTQDQGFLEELKQIESRA